MKGTSELGRGLPLTRLYRPARLSGGLTSITKQHLTSLCSSCILRTLVKPPLPSRRLSGGRKARRSPIAMASTPKAAGSKTKVHVLFVCLGNICRSPTAEAVFRSVVERAGLQDQIVIDSCGTGGGNPDWYKEKGWAYHEGDPSDQRMLAAAAKRSVCLTSRSRPLRPEDMGTFEYILGMDFENNATIQVAADHWLARGKHIPSNYRQKVQLMCKYLNPDGGFKGIMEVPDPYYGGAKGFELVLDLLEDACTGLLQHIQEHDLHSRAAQVV
ncbi:hypothetical protein CVIRNUC_005985 [Coccomyxa viridis]|uniref:Phosphotyrosine protein phosphatase I domain-containing protein n=1 Tax=Coccomyxa viridis TaxID=1274662 RepID=A0AAV1I916_9CHLO|nr:hypothetical protein CVIRNUC_005985 [Coccomyxa viridis]